jgi:hypothetical protein
MPPSLAASLQPTALWGKERLVRPAPGFEEMAGQADHCKGIASILAVQGIAQSQDSDLVAARGEDAGDLRYVVVWPPMSGEKMPVTTRRCIAVAAVTVLCRCKVSMQD